MDRTKPYWSICLVCAFIATAFFSKDAYTLSLIKTMTVAALVASSLRFVTLIGELNFAIPAFVALGAYGVGVTTTQLQWPMWVALLVAVVAPAVASIPFGFVTLRVKGHYFLLTSFAFTESVRILLSKSDALGGNSGMVGIFAPAELDWAMPAITVAIGAALIFILFRLERSDFGKILTGIRDNENVMKTAGVNVLAQKVACLAVASTCSGMAGGLQAFSNNVISPGDFSFLIAAFALAAVKVGGEASVMGAVVGAILLTLLGSYAMGFGADQDTYYGAAIVLVVLLMPKGLLGLLDRKRRVVRRADGKKIAEPGTELTNGGAR